MMVTEGNLLLLIFHILLNIDANSGFLDIDELTSVNYGIDIINKPVLIGQGSPDGSIHLTSKYGQQYQCTYPDRVAEDQMEREEEQAAIKTGIPDLLRPMANAPCLFRPKDWWVYEFCYGKHVRQYHVEDDKIVGNSVYLGYYESDFDWNNITAKDKKRLYHSQYYVNGSTCDLTNKPRRTEVQFRCEEGQGEYIFEVGEAETCVYTIVVHTPRVCHHPYLKKPTPAKPVPITCKPLLTLEQYDDYLQNLLENSNVEEEDVVGETEDVVGKKEEREGDAQTERLQKLLLDSLTQGLKDIQEKDSSNLQGKEEEGVQVKVVKSKAEFEKYLDDLMKVKQGSDGAERTADNNVPTVGKEAVPTPGQVDSDEDDDKKLVEEFEKELNVIAPTADQKDRLADYDENVASAMQAQFSDIVDEAEQELAGDGIDGPVDRKQAFGKLAKSLTQLVKKLQKAEKEMEDVDSHLREAVETKTVAQSDTASREDTAGGSQNTEGVRPVETTGSREDDAHHTDTKLQPHESTPDGADNSFQPDENVADGADTKLQHHEGEAHGVDTKLQHHDGAGPKQAREQGSPPAIDNRVRVRVTRIKHQSPDGGDTSQPEPMNSQGSPQMPEEQRRQLETSVKKELQKAGLDDQGQKIQVKIITAGYFDSESDTVHVLSEEESSAFNNMIVTILGGNNKAAKELARQKEMEEAYNYVWGKPAKHAKRQQTVAPPS